MSELIVSAPLLAVGKDLVGFRCLFKLAVCIGVVRIAVRVVFHRDTAICLLDVLLRGRSINSKHFVIVAFRHNSGMGSYKHHAPS